ncbi:LysR family transcriptional regulator [Luteimonas lutimaris]|uniref:LysR substrate-binding domain-containing protein n=1 Tax=Luteimonas lutimaris TaxID=698645 RepID=A0ABP7MJE9_9GAMM|nr:LysR family transcriptional regulator [Luteimonas sp.]
MRFRQIEVFHAVYTTGSISAAARALHVSQPSVSKVLHHTQYQLGLTLFTLVRGRLVATDEAHALFVEVSEIFDRLTSLQKTVGNIRNVGGGHIRLGVVPSLGLHAAPLAIARFRKQHPRVTFDVQTLHHDELFQALYERRVDVAIAYDAPEHPRMKHRVLDMGQLMLLFGRDELPDAGDAIPLSLLDGRDMVGLTTGGPVGDAFTSELKRHDVVIHEVVSNQTFYIAAALTRCGAGMTVVDEFTARAGAGDTVRFRPLDPPIRFKIECVYLEDRPPSKTAGEFIDLLASVIEEIRVPAD